MTIKREYITFIFLLGIFSVVFPQQQSQSIQTINGTVVINGPDTVCAGSSGFMTLVGASSTPAKWQVSTTGGASWSNIVNTNITNTYFMAMNNLCYRAILVNGDTSQMTCLTVDAQSDAGNISGGGSFCNSATGQLVTAGSNGVPSGWFQVAGSSYTGLSNTSTSQNFTNITQSTTYAFITKNGVCPADTSSITITVDALSDAGTLSGNTSVCSSSNSGTITNSGITGTIVHWQASVNGGSSWFNLGTLTPTHPYTNLTQSTEYHLIVKSGVCPADTSNTITINVDQAPVAGTLSGGDYFCGAAASGTLTLTGYSGTITAWQSSVNNGTTWTNTSCTGTTCAYTNVTQATLYRVVINSGVCPTVYSTPDTVTYSASSVAGTLSALSDSVCVGDSVQLSLNGATANHFQWQLSTNAGTSWTNLPATTSGIGLPQTVNSVYQVIVSNNNCPSDTSGLISITSVPFPLVHIINNDTIIEQGNNVTLTATGNGTPQWSPTLGLNATNTFTTIASPYTSTLYYLTLSANGCSSRDSVNIEVHQGDYTGLIANTLTPNGDGVNDAFYIEHIENFKSSDLSIFNEYGQLIFSARPYLNDWKGTYNNARLPDGTYFYVLKFSDKPKVFKGSITLMSQK